MTLFLKYLRPFFKRMAIGTTIKFLGTIMDLFLPWILAYIIDSVIPQRNVSAVFLWGGIMVICSIFAISGNVIANRMASSVARDATQTIRHDLFETVSYLSIPQIDETGIPSLVSRLTSDTYNVHQTIGMMQRIGIRAPILLIGGIAITATLDPVLTLVLVSIMPLTIIVTTIISKKGIPLYGQVQIKIDRLVRVVRENISGARVIKALSKGDYEINRFDQVNRDLINSQIKAGTTMAATPPLMDLFLNLGLTLVVLVSAFRVNANLTQPGVIIAFLSYFTIILTAMLNITRIFVIFTRGIASANRIDKVLVKTPELEPISPEEAEAKSHLPSISSDSSDQIGTDISDHLVFEQVDFTYPNNRKKTLSNINFRLKRGQTIGIIGPTGSGKSTIAKLLLRLYDVSSGRILINGHDIRTIQSADLHQKFGVVLQKDVLFSQSIADNIQFGRHFTTEDLLESIDHAQAKEFIDKVPGKLDYRLKAKGNNLSGGQKQRVLLSRAMAGSPEFLILDDSSSALDYQTDAKLRTVLKQDYPNTTKVIIAQRIASIQHADIILLLNHGTIIGSGNHQDLLSHNTTYREIYEEQTGVTVTDETI